MTTVAAQAKSRMSQYAASRNVVSEDEAKRFTTEFPVKRVAVLSSGSRKMIGGVAKKGITSANDAGAKKVLAAYVEQLGAVSRPLELTANHKHALWSTLCHMESAGAVTWSSDVPRDLPSVRVLTWNDDRKTALDALLVLKPGDAPSDARQFYLLKKGIGSNKDMTPKVAGPYPMPQIGVPRTWKKRVVDGIQTYEAGKNKLGLNVDMTVGADWTQDHDYRVDRAKRTITMELEMYVASGAIFGRDKLASVHANSEHRVTPGTWRIQVVEKATGVVLRSKTVEVPG